MKISKKKYPGGDLNQGPKLRLQSSLSAIRRCLPSTSLPPPSVTIFLYTKQGSDTYEFVCMKT
jgi:hypothetical protein